MKSCLKTFLLILLGVIPCLLYSQGIPRPEIYGDSMNDRSGNAISLSAYGDVLAIGTELNDSNGTDAGKVAIYEWNGRGWIQKGTDLFGAAAGDKFGRSLQLSHDGETIIIGSPFNGTGKIEVFEWNGSSWVLKGSSISSSLNYERFGYSVAINADGNVIAVGSPRADTAGPDRGIVKVYSWSGSFWNNIGTIQGDSPYDEFGFSIAISDNGKRIAIGAPFNDGYLTNSGHTKVLEYNGLTWSQLGNDIEGESSQNVSGTSVALNGAGNTVAIGAPTNNNLNGLSGHVRVYKWNGSSWNQSGSDIDGEAASDYFGSAVTLSSDGSILAVGAKLNNGSGNNSGHARVYQFQGTNWVQMGVDIDGDTTNDQLGIAVSLDSLGLTFAVSAPYNDQVQSDVGQVKTFDIGSLVGIETLDNNEPILVSPNPFSEKFSIAFTNSNSGTIFIHDLSGKLLFNKSFSHLQEIEIDVDLPTGPYHLMIQTDDSILLNKLLIKD